MPILQNLKYIYIFKKKTYKHNNEKLRRIDKGQIDWGQTAMGPDWFGARMTRNPINTDVVSSILDQGEVYNIIR